MIRVVAAATKIDGLIIVGARHCDSIMRATLKALGKKYSPEHEGFIDQYGIFMTREMAWKVANAANQIIRQVGGNESGRLYSENLY